MPKIHDMTTDGLDRELISLLRADARTPVADLARALGLSRTTVQSRLERLERSKRITGYTVKLSESYERGQICAYVMITVHPKQAAAVADQIQAMSGVRRLHSVSGPADLIALVEASTASDVDALIGAVSALDGVERTASCVILSTKFDR